MTLITVLKGSMSGKRYRNNKLREEMIFVNSLAPGDWHPTSVKAGFWEALRRFLRNIKARSCLQLTGDLYAHLDSAVALPWIGGSGFSEIEDSNGAELRNLCLEY